MGVIIHHVAAVEQKAVCISATGILKITAGTLYQIAEYGVQRAVGGFKGACQPLWLLRYGNPPYRLWTRSWLDSSDSSHFQHSSGSRPVIVV
jgi:hypothetical protein